MNAAARTPGVDAMGAWGGGDGEWSGGVAEGILNELLWMSSRG
jgi:hypothetical protein